MKSPKRKSSAARPLHAETLALHAGQTPDPVTGARAVPIYQTTSFVFRSCRQAAELFALRAEGHMYSRISNPTVEVLEKRMAALDGGVGALAVASGQAAVALAVLNLAKAGDEIVSADNVYGGTYNLFHYTLPRMGLRVKFVRSNDLAAFEKAIGPRTRAVYAEGVGNPKLDIADVERLSQLAHRHGLPLIVDNTFMPCLMRPFDHGADVIVYSATKFICGHGTTIAGLIVDSGRFEWTPEAHPVVAGPEPSYHGLDFVEAFGKAAYIAKARATLLRDLGPALGPAGAFLLLQGLETLPLRMARHSENALALARHLARHPKVAWVNYPGLPDSPERARVRKYLPLGAGAMLGFGVRGGKAAGMRFIEALGMISHSANLGDAKSLAIHPASTTHSQLSPEEQRATGVTPDYVRVSVGLEHIDDILADVDQALRKA